MRHAILETTRLRLRPLVPADLDAWLAMDLDPDVRRYLFPHDPPTPEAHRAVLHHQLVTGWPAEGGVWTVEWKETPGFLGWCGLFPLEDTGLIEIGYRYIRAVWGRGVATEAGGAVLDHGFSGFGFDPIVAVCHPQNHASRRVLEKLGFATEGAAFHYGLTVACYRLRRADYRAARAAKDGP